MSAGCSVGPRTGPQDIYEDIESGDEADNLVRRIGSANLTPMDWNIVRLLGNADEGELADYARRLADFDPLRFEALIHAWPKETDLPLSRLFQIERWQEVEEAKQRFIELGLTKPLAEVVETFSGAVSELSGKSRWEALAELMDAEDARLRLVKTG